MISDILDILPDQKKIDKWIVGIVNDAGMPISLDSTIFAGELKDVLSDMTSSYSYFSQLLADAKYIVNYLYEYIDSSVANSSEKLKSPYKGKLTAAEKSEKVRSIKISVSILGKNYGTHTIQEIRFWAINAQYIQDYLSAIVDIISKSLYAGSTILAYQRTELEQTRNI